MVAPVGVDGTFVARVPGGVTFIRNLGIKNSVLQVSGLDITYAITHRKCKKTQAEGAELC